jgi:hypothetical protein
MQKDEAGPSALQIKIAPWHCAARACEALNNRTLSLKESELSAPNASFRDSSMTVKKCSSEMAGFLLEKRT